MLRVLLVLRVVAAADLVAVRHLRVRLALIIQLVRGAGPAADIEQDAICNWQSMASLTYLHLRIAHAELLVRTKVLDEIVSSSSVLQASIPAWLLGMRGDILDVRRRLDMLALWVHLLRLL